MLTFPLWLGPALGLAAAGLLALLLALLAPVFVPLIAVTHPAQFAPVSRQWLALLLFAPLVAAACVRNPDAARGLPRGPRGRITWPYRRALLVRRLRQGLLVLTVPAVAALLVLLPKASVVTAALDGDARSQRAATFQLLEMSGAAAVALAIVVAGCRWWDRTFVPLATAVTPQTVQEAAARARRDLRALEAHRADVDRLLQRLHAQLAGATSERDFHRMCQLHRESHQCGTVQRDYFQMVLSGCNTMRWLACAARSSATPRMIPLRDPQTGRHRRLDADRRARMRAGAQELAQLRRTMEERADDNLLRVNQLNMGTAGLRDQIRDECGPRGWNWYQEHAGARLRGADLRSRSTPIPFRRAPNPRPVPGR